MGRHVTVNRLEIQHVKRDALNNTYVCQASNTKLVPPAERTVRVEMLCKSALRLEAVLGKGRKMRQEDGADQSTWLINFHHHFLAEIPNIAHNHQR
jgi:hypothetical protein